MEDLQTFLNTLDLLHMQCLHTTTPSVAPLLRIPEESGTFQDTAATFFNSLPSHIRNIKD